MDPTANMAEMIRLAHKLIESEDAETARLADLAFSFCSWYATGGFTPKRDLMADIIRHLQG